MGKGLTKAEMAKRIAELEWCLRRLTEEIADQRAKLQPVIRRDMDVDNAFCILQGTAAYCEGRLQ